MPDNIEFSLERTWDGDNMMPLGDEEINAIWGRKMGQNVAAAMGTWTKVILGEFLFDDGLSAGWDGYAGRATIDLTGLGYTQAPAIDLYQLRGGTIALREQWIPHPDYGASSMIGCRTKVTLASGQLEILEAPNYETGVRADFRNASTREQFGTFIFRLRGI